MKVTRRSPLTGQLNTLELPITDAEVARWECGELIQDVWPNLSADEREFLMTGLTAGEFEKFLGTEE